MERGNAKHGPRQDDALAEDLAGHLGPGGSNLEEWADPEPPADDDPPARTDLPTGQESDRDDTQDGPRNDKQDDVEMRRLQHDMDVADDRNPNGSS